MSLLPENLERYKKFIGFALKYWNSDVFQHASDSALNHAVQEEKEDDEDSYQKPEELVEDLKNMGPTYIKLGQTLSTRPDLMPEVYMEALTSLQDDVDAIPYAEIQKIVEEEIGTKISKAFESFEEKPLASASIGQVHRAVLRSEKEVVVKVQRPGVRKSFIEDLDTLKEMVDLAVKHTKVARKYALDSVLDEMRHILLNELDYIKEAQNLVTLGTNLQRFENIVVPQPVLDYSTSRILTMDYVEGKKITSIHSIQRIDNDFTPLVDDLVEAYLQQIIVDGFAHADPHPGNVHLSRDNKILLMDLGMVAKFSPDLQEHILRLLIAVSKYDGDSAANVLLDISEYDREADLDSFRKEINRLVLDAQNKTALDMQTGKVLIQMNKIAAEKGIRISVELNILGKILLNLDQIVAVLTPKYDLQASIQRYVEKIMAKKLTQQLKPENFFAEIIQAKKLFEKLPERLNKITENLADNKFEIKIDAIDEQRLTDGFQKVANRITMGLIIAALIVGAALLMRIPTTFTIAGYPGFAMICFIAAGLIGIWLVIKMMLKDEDFKFRR